MKHNEQRQEQAVFTSEEPIAQLVYRSAASSPMGHGELAHLLAQARARNEAERLTGLLVYDQGRFVQWLEGPTTGVERIWDSIRRDSRHVEVERLHTPWHPERLFPEWRMQLGTRTDSQHALAGLSLPERELTGLRSAANTVADFMDSMAFWQALPPARQMLHALTSPDDNELEALIELVSRFSPSMTALGLHLLSPVAQALGDAWRDDRCDATTLLVAQMRLQVLMRRVVATWKRSSQRALRRALVTVLPGEVHLTGLTFASLALDAAGWSVDCGFPRNIGELQALVREQPYEVLHIALSDAFEREDRLSSLASAIREVRRASMQPQLQVLVSGRAFAMQPGLAVVVGADGDGLAQGSDAPDLEAMLAWARIRRQSPGMMVAQSMINGLAVSLQRKRFPDPPSDPPATADT